MAGSAIRSRFAGHPGRSSQTRHALRLKPDHFIGAGQERTAGTLDESEGAEEISALIRTLRSQSMRVCAVLHPTRTELMAGESRGLATIADIFAMWGIPVNMFGETMSHRVADAYRDDIHINAVGQQLLADELVRCAERARLPVLED